MEINEGLGLCYYTANLLKRAYPNELMKIKDNTIIIHSVKNSRLLGGKKHMGSMSNRYAHFNRENKRVVITQKYLKDPNMLRTKVNNQSDRVILNGNFAIIELICHELAHFRTKGHAKSFKIKYNKFLNYMVQYIFSGDLYNKYEVFD